MDSHEIITLMESWKKLLFVTATGVQINGTDVRGDGTVGSLIGRSQKGMKRKSWVYQWVLTFKIVSSQKVVPLRKEIRWYDGLLLRQETAKSIHRCLKYFKCVSNNFMALPFDSIATLISKPYPQRLTNLFCFTHWLAIQPPRHQ